jgi:PKD repeat protein
VTLAAATATATSIIPPENLGELASMADAVVLAQAGFPRVSQRGALLFTLTSFRVLVPVAGMLEHNDRLTVQAPGGESDGIAWLVAGSPRFKPGHVYLLFLHERPDGIFLPQMMAYGLLHRVVGRDGSALLAPLPEQGSIEVFPTFASVAVEPVETYQETLLLAHLRGVAAHRETWTARAVTARPEQLPLDAEAQSAPAGCVFEQGSPGSGYPTYGFRWHTFETGGSVTMYYGGNPPAGDASRSDGGLPEFQSAVGMWSGIADTNINLIYGAGSTYAMDCGQGQPGAYDNYVMFNDPCNDIADLVNCTGILGFGGPWFGTPPNTTPDGTTWWTIISQFVVLNNGITVSCLSNSSYQNMVAHEFGHGLGFGHITGQPSLMNPSCEAGTCTGIQPIDITCAQYIYPAAGPAPTPTRTPTPTGPTPTPTRTPTPGPSPTPTWTPTTGPQPTHTPTSPAAPPIAPTGVSASDGAYPNKVRVTWNASVTATTYQVWRNTINVTSTATYLSALPGMLYDDTTASPSVIYYYWVRAGNSAGWGGFSAPDTGYAGTAGPTPTPAPPTPTATPIPTTGGLAASFTYAPATPYTGKRTQFTDTSSGEPRSWQWTFGDGGSSTDRNPTHSWAKRGTYTVTLVVTSGPTNAQASKTITVDARARRHLS